jgi:hypothetical protein
MLQVTHLRPATGLFLVAVLGGTSLGGCQLANAPSAPSASSTTATVTASPGPTPDVVEGGLITLTETACTWDGNPGSMTAGRLGVAVRNETDDYGLFILHRLRPGRTFEEGRAVIRSIQEALKTGGDWPAELSDAVSEAPAEAGQDGEMAAVATGGTYGVVCSANTSSTGDVLTVFLVGPLEVTDP